MRVVRALGGVALIAVLLVAAAPRLARANDGSEASSSGSSESSDVPDPWHAAGDSFEAHVPAEGRRGDHRVASLAALGGIYTTFTVWAYFAWYHGVPNLPEFKVGGDGYFGEDSYAGGADKLGHFWANMALTRMTSRLLRWGGWKPVPAALISGGLSSVYFAFVEVKDGYYYQLSPGDLIANTLGAALGAAMEASPRLDELFDVRVEYWPSDEYKAVVRGEAEAEINTINIAEDYSGQKYLLALHLGAFEQLREGRWTGASRYLDVVLGFHADKYKPDPLPDSETARRQSLYLGLSLNLQGAVDHLLGGGGGRGRRTAWGVLHGLSEVGNVPFTSMSVVDSTRTPDD